MASQSSAGKLHFRKLLSGSFFNAPVLQSDHTGYRKKYTWPAVFALLITAWAIINLLQSYFTPIANDEAYYWMFSQYLDWGYFDHPPMIAAMIRTGDLIFHGELGTRLLTVISQIIALILIWKIIDEREVSATKIWLYFGLAAVIPVFAIYGFIATPDSPLLLFTALFLFSYKRFLINQNYLSVFLVALAMAGMMYSKYHGALVILFVVLSNLNLLRNSKFWLAGISALIFFAPHLLWQFRNNFPTLEYQMMDRMEPIHAQHFLEYWLNQAIAFNPIILFLCGCTFFKLKPVSAFDRSLFFIAAGFFIFFWISSIWTRAEPHWTAAASIPATILVYRFLSQEKIRMAKSMTWISISAIIILLARLTIIFDFLPVPHEFSKQKEWVQSVSNQAGNLPAVFVNTFQKPSVYTFYTGKTSFALNNVYYRKTQFDIWDFENDFQGKEVAFFVQSSDSLRIINASTINTGRFNHFKDTLYSFQNLEVDFTLPSKKTFKSGELVTFHSTIRNATTGSIHWKRHDLSLSAVFIRNKMLTTLPVTIKKEMKSLMPGDISETEISFRIPIVANGDYSLLLGYRTSLLPETFHSRSQKIRIRHTKPQG